MGEEGCEADLEQISSSCVPVCKGLFLCLAVLYKVITEDLNSGAVTVWCVLGTWKTPNTVHEADFSYPRWPLPFNLVARSLRADI